MTFHEHRIDWDDAKVSRLWDYYARTSSPDIYFSKAYGGRILRATGLPLKTRLDVLDFGCGPGFLWEHLVGSGAAWDYTGIDFSPGSIARLEDKARGHPRFRGAHHLKALPSPLATGQFDVVLLCEVVEHLSDDHLGATVGEAGRLLKPGGVVVVTTPNDEDLSRCTRLCPECGALFHEWQHVRSWNAATLGEAFRPHGLSLRRATALDFSTPGTLGRAARWARRLRGRRSPGPHLLGVFQKGA